MNDVAVTLTLSVAEVNLILQALGNLPYVQVAGVLQNIKNEAERQVAAAQEAPAVTE